LKRRFPASISRETRATIPARGHLRWPQRLQPFTRLRHHSPRTEDAYLGWIKRFIFFHCVRHSDALGTVEVNQILTDLALPGRGSA
jgi:hypothetical protein